MYPGNKALEYLEFRIKHENYRGGISSEHNRYTFNQIIKLLELLNKYSPNQKLMAIRTADISKRKENTPEEIIYSKFCSDVKKDTGIGTQDAMRKNLFVDLHRMGFIVRYNKNKEPTDPFKKEAIKFVSISNQGLKLLCEKSIVDKYFIFSKGIDQLLNGQINTVLSLFKDLYEFRKIKHVSCYDYMFFISAIGVPYEFNLTKDQAINLIIEFRALPPTIQKAVIDKLKVNLNPANYSGNKKNLRDFHNWKNKIMQIFYLLEQTIYFDISNEEKLILASKNIDPDFNIKLYRSIRSKDLYFMEHKIKKTAGFELHHIVPISWAESKEHFKILDRWENMLYIDGYSHAKITQNRNRNIILNITADNIVLKDYSDNEIYLVYKNNVLYNLNNKDTLKNYNFELLNATLNKK